MSSIRSAFAVLVMTAAFALLVAPTAYSQETPPAAAQDQTQSDTAATADQPADAQAADAQPAAPADGQAIMARVIEVHGDVKWAPLDSQEYTPCKLDDEYPPKTKIITGVRSSVKLQIGDEEPYTCMLIEAVGKTVLSEAYKTDDTKHVRVGVGYGRIRAGVAEGGLKSDFTVDSPVATLSKRGTWGFTLFYERDTDYFDIGLADRGLVEAINRINNDRRSLSPGERVTHAMRFWLDQAQFDRNVPIPDILGQGDIDVAFNRIQQSGLGVLHPGQGSTVLINLTNRSAQTDFANLLRQSFGGTLPHVDVNHGLRAEGFFGTGRGDQLVDVLIDSANPLVQKGMAKAGRYRFRQSAVAEWMRNHDPK